MPTNINFNDPITVNICVSDDGGVNIYVLDNNGNPHDFEFRTIDIYDHDVASYDEQRAQDDTLNDTRDQRSRDNATTSNTVINDAGTGNHGESKSNQYGGARVDTDHYIPRNQRTTALARGGC